MPFRSIDETSWMGAGKATLVEALFRRMVNLTAAAFSGVPSWNRTPERSFTETVRGSTMVAAVASSGARLPSGCGLKSESFKSWPTMFPVSSMVAFTGSNAIGRLKSRAYFMTPFGS